MERLLAGASAAAEGCGAARLLVRQEPERARAAGVDRCGRGLEGRARGAGTPQDSLACAFVSKDSSGDVAEQEKEEENRRLRSEIAAQRYAERDAAIAR